MSEGNEAGKESMIIFMILVGIILIMESSVFIYMTLRGWFSHIPMWVLAISLLAGISLLIAAVHYKKRMPTGDEENLSDEVAPYLRKLLQYVPIDRPMVAAVVGLAIMTFAFTHYLIGIGGKNLGEGDLILIIFSFFIIMYPYIPNSYSLERDFILTFLGFLAIFMSILPFLFSMGDENFKYYFLTYPVHRLLLFIGVDNMLVPPDRIYFSRDGVNWTMIIIARSCSGIDSFSIFSSAFIAFVLVVYRKIDLRSVLFMVFGILLAYIGNVVRMTIVVASGYYYGADVMKFVHENLGYVIFFAWMSLFWYLLYRYLMKDA